MASVLFWYHSAIFVVDVLPIVISLFVGEFIIYKLRFKDHDPPKFTDYIKIVFHAQRGSAK